MSVTCDRYREAASAQLDGEPIGMPATALEQHIAACSDCARWLDSVTSLGRSFRVTAQTTPDLTDRVLERVVVSDGRVRARRRWLRGGLATVGLVQWALAVPGLSGDSVGMHMAMHASHESAAWNVALGASFIAVAVRPARAIGAAPILATFLTALALLSLPDIVSGQVPAARLASHAGVVLGLLLIVLLNRSNRLLPDTPLAFSDDASDVIAGPQKPTGLRAVPNQQGVA